MLTKFKCKRCGMSYHSMQAAEMCYTEHKSDNGELPVGESKESSPLEPFFAGIGAFLNGRGESHSMGMD